MKQLEIIIECFAFDNDLQVKHWRILFVLKFLKIKIVRNRRISYVIEGFNLRSRSIQVDKTFEQVKSYAMLCIAYAMLCKAFAMLCIGNVIDFYNEPSTNTYETLTIQYDSIGKLVRSNTIHLFFKHKQLDDMVHTINHQHNTMCCVENNFTNVFYIEQKEFFN